MKLPNLYMHTETGTVARLVREQYGLLVLKHPRWGECRWAPHRARKMTPAEVDEFRYCHAGHEGTITESSCARCRAQSLHDRCHQGARRTLTGSTR